MKWNLLLVFLFGIFAHAQNSPSQINVIDFQTADVSIELDPNTTQVKGSVDFTFNVLQDTNTFFVDAKNLISSTIQLNGEKVTAVYDGNTLRLNNSLKAGSEHSLSIQYVAFPSKALYHIDTNADANWDQVWTQGQGKYTSNWVPSIDDIKDKMVWSISIAAPDHLKAIANGRLVDKQPLDEKMKWSYQMTRPMSSYLLAFVVGDYEFEQYTSASGVDLQLYYYTGAGEKVAPTYKGTRDLFNFLEAEIGVAYPWQNYKQVPVKDFLYSGMENTSLTIFNDQFFTDALGANDRSYYNVNAHELAHQWFGNLVTETDSKHHWLHEGFASYYALLAEKERFGNAYFQTKLYEYAEALNEQTAKGNSTALLDPKANSLTFYQHGAWALYALQDQVGASRFRESVQTYLQQFAYQNVTTEDFLDIVAEVSGVDLINYKKIWLTDNGFPTAEALILLRKDMFMEAYLQLASRRISSFDEAYNTYKETLVAPVHKELVKEMVAQLSMHQDPRKYELLKAAAALEDVEVNQLIALSTAAVNEDNRDLIRSLLTEPSYVTREAALFLMWNDVENKRQLLDDVRSSWTQMNPSLEMAWRVLALNSADYKNSELLAFLTELQAYTLPKYSTATRTAAFDYLISLEAMGKQNYVDLIEASTHPVWRFYEDARAKLIRQYKIPSEKALIDEALILVPKTDREKIQKLLKIDQ